MPHVKVADPVMAARRYGGATYEPSTGWWTDTQDPSAGTPLTHRRRCAIYLPTRSSSGEQINSDRVA